jgi:hypothetical protein
MDAEYYKKWRENNRERSRQISAEYEQRRRLDDPYYYVKKIYRERKRIAISKGLPFDIILEDLLPVPETCPVLGIPLIPGKGVNNPNAPSLDRLIPEKGYTKENVFWLSWRANRIKSDSSLDEMEKLILWMKTTSGEISKT